MGRDRRGGSIDDGVAAKHSLTFLFVDWDLQQDVERVVH